VRRVAALQKVQPDILLAGSWRGRLCSVVVEDALRSLLWVERQPTADVFGRHAPLPHARQAPEVGEDRLGVGAGPRRSQSCGMKYDSLGTASSEWRSSISLRSVDRCVPLFDFGPRPERYSATLELPEIEPLGAAHAVEPRSIDVGLLDSHE
jgi:hypothetical protein